MLGELSATSSDVLAQESRHEDRWSGIEPSGQEGKDASFWAPAVNWSQPIQTDIKLSTPATTRIITMLGQHDFRVYLSDKAYVEVGAGSFPVIGNMTLAPGDWSGLLGRVGRYCEFSKSSSISVKGEHDNDNPINVVFAGVPLVRHSRSIGLKPVPPFSIGNNVVVSDGARVLPGVSIGDGVVVGAGAVVSRDLDDFTICVGVPAKPIKERRRSFAWWDLEPSFLFDNLDQIGEMDGGPMRKPAPAFAVKQTSGGIEFLGFVENGEPRPIQHAPSKVRDHVIQALTKDDPIWLANCWA